MSITFDDGVSIANFHAANHPRGPDRSAAGRALADYQRILSECVERGGRPDVVIMAMDCAMRRRTEREAANTARVGRQRIRTSMRSIITELTQSEE